MQQNQTKHNRRALYFWVIVLLDLLFTGAYLALTLLNQTIPVDWSTVASAAFPLAGAFILFQRPQNRFGQVLTVMGLLMVFEPSLQQYAVYTLQTRPGSLPLGPEVIWLFSWLWTAWNPLPVIAILTFPDGALPSPRWRWLILLSILVTILMVALTMIVSWPLRGKFLFSAAAAVGAGPAAYQAFFKINQYFSIFFAFTLVLAVWAVALRFKRSSGVERQQLKWIFLALIPVPFSIGLAAFANPQSSQLLLSTFFIVDLLATIGFPIAMTFAVTRYHLYDIDVILRRTLLYGTLTVALGLLYGCSIILLQTLLANVGGSHSPVILVLSTLVSAAAFNPLRMRFQAIIDRRFFRQKYNSSQILERFTTRLRAEVDLGAINHHLLAVVDESLQPGFSTLWLATEGRGRSEEKDIHR